MMLGSGSPVDDGGSHRRAEAVKAAKLAVSAVTSSTSEARTAMVATAVVTVVVADLQSLIDKGLQARK